MAVQTEHVLFRPDYQAGEQTKTLEPIEQQQLGHAFTRDAIGIPAAEHGAQPPLWHGVPVRDRRVGDSVMEPEPHGHQRAGPARLQVVPRSAPAERGGGGAGRLGGLRAERRDRGRPAGDREHEHLAVLGRADDPRALQRPGRGPVHRQRPGHVDVPAGGRAPRPGRDPQRRRPLEGARLVPGGQGQDLRSADRHWRRARAGAGQPDWALAVQRQPARIDLVHPGGRPWLRVVQPAHAVLRVRPLLPERPGDRRAVRHAGVHQARHARGAVPGAGLRPAAADGDPGPPGRLPDPERSGSPPRRWAWGRGSSAARSAT